MKTKAVRLYGKRDIRLEEFDLPPIAEDEILAEVISDSICMSSYKAAMQGTDHKRVPNDIAQNPVMLGHECCGVILEVGAKWRDQFSPGMKFALQPAINYMGRLETPGYAYQYVGGNATYIVIPHEVMEMDCLLPYDGEAFFYGSLAEPMSCIVGTYHAMYHTENGVYAHQMGIIEGGNLALLASAGPMGLGAIDYAMNCDRRPKRIAVTDIDQARLDRAQSIYSAEMAAQRGVELRYFNTAQDGAEQAMMDFTQGHGYDDVMVYAPVRAVVEQADRILARDGCLNFFAGPSDGSFSAMMNFYNVHYLSTHVVGTSGGNTEDMRESLSMMADGRINPASMITHVGGLNCAADTTLNLPDIPGGKKLVYTHLDLPLTALEDMAKSDDPLLKALGEIVAGNNGLWCAEAEEYLLAHGKKI